MPAPDLGLHQAGSKPATATTCWNRVVSPRRWPRRQPRYDTVVAGAGVAGTLLGACLARQGGQRVLLGDSAGSIESVLGRPSLGLDLAELLDHPQIDLLLDADQTKLKQCYPNARLIPAEPLDEYFAERSRQADPGVLRSELAEVVEVLLCDLQPTLDVLSSVPGSSCKRRYVASA